MPVTVVNHEVSRQVMAVVTGDVGITEIMAFVAAARAGEQRSWAFIFDTSGAVIDLSSADVQSVAEFTAAEFQKSPIGPVALIASDVAIFGISRMFQAYSSASGRPNVGVFRTLEEAQSWLSRIKQH
jgi:hypothetical protein